MLAPFRVTDWQREIGGGGTRIGAELPVDAARAPSDPIASYLASLASKFEAPYLGEFVELAGRVADASTTARLSRAARRLEQRALLRELRDGLLPLAISRRTSGSDLRPWGYGPPPRSF